MTDVARLRILGFPVDPLDELRAARRVAGCLAARTPLQVVTLNAEMAIWARRQPDLGAVVSAAGLVLPDGSGIVWAARRRGCKIRKLAGVEFIHEICAACARAKRPVYLLGAGPGVAQAAAEALVARHRGLVIAGVRDGYFGPEEEEAVLAAIREARPGALLVALGVPRQELWIARHLSALGVPVAMGVGGSFDVLSGRVARAPAAMRALHLEWLYRLAREPWRWRRILSALPAFAILALASERHERYTEAGAEPAAPGRNV